VRFIVPFYSRLSACECAPLSLFRYFLLCSSTRETGGKRRVSLNIRDPVVFAASPQLRSSRTCIIIRRKFARLFESRLGRARRTITLKTRCLRGLATSSTACPLFRARAKCTEPVSVTTEFPRLERMRERGARSEIQLRIRARTIRIPTQVVPRRTARIPLNTAITSLISFSLSFAIRIRFR